MPVTWYTGKVTDIVLETPLVKRFFISVEGLERFDFLAGQFITLDLPVSDKRLQRWRSYSIANAPDGTNILELCIVRKYDGLGSTYMFEEIEVGSEIKFKGPDGNFILPANLEDQDLVMICTGTGIAPFRSMIHHIQNNGIKYRSLHLIFGARYASDILYRQEWQNQNWKDFKWDVALSREAEWTGHRGYVHDIYMNQYSEVNSNRKFLICGWTAMIDEAVANLILKLGYDKKQVVYELYG